MELQVPSLSSIASKINNCDIWRCLKDIYGWLKNGKWSWVCLFTSQRVPLVNTTFGCWYIYCRAILDMAIPQVCRKAKSYQNIDMCIFFKCTPLYLQNVYQRLIGIEGNEAADLAARHAADNQLIDETPIRYDDMKNDIRNIIFNEWQAEYDSMNIKIKAAKASVRPWTAVQK
nr:unnamed protein product [Callosobruchus analis]